MHIALFYVKSIIVTTINEKTTFKAKFVNVKDVANMF